ncbi:cyclic nucleotide-binding domain-containing protein 2-like isoform X2 [Salmo salar]|uniref:Cyclic nucleotide-binding domain-containing protein 2-like isoform X2 n=1 Tax=Salmo salar TaxID=8030 RepID=A0ABM3D5P4_SALSA|nr:cyclic nucleotide-binding domain-containing protein 2-like isoform X2 [Salmo salar]XP_045554133.1 cyclic nucleotide-binding domain-containing protein 2-like isoform X2 [Salmo salar]
METGEKAEKAAKEAKTDLKDVPSAVLHFQQAAEMLFSAPVQAAPCRGKLGFKWAVRSVILMTRFCRYFMSRSNSRQFMEFNFRETITNQPAGGTGKNLVFDLNHFKVKEDRIPVLLVEIMRKCPEERSESEVLLVHNMLSSVSMFRRYSGTLQLLLARVVRYQRLEVNPLSINCKKMSFKTAKCSFHPKTKCAELQEISFNPEKFSPPTRGV